MSTHLHCHIHVHARYLLEAEEETGTYTHFCPSSSRMLLWSLGYCLRSSPMGLGSPIWLAQAADSLFGCVPGHQQLTPFKKNCINFRWKCKLNTRQVVYHTFDQAQQLKVDLHDSLCHACGQSLPLSCLLNSAESFWVIRTSICTVTKVH